MKPKPTKRQREWMQKYRLAPGTITQIAVMKKLGLAHRQDFYRLFHHCTIADSREDYQ